MNLRTPFAALLTAILFAACSNDVVVAPLKAPTGANLTVGTGSGSGNYMALVKPNSVKSFTDAVTALGGTVTYIHSKAGLATVSGLSESAAAQLSGASSVVDIQPDEVVSLESPAPAAIDNSLTVGDPSIASQANPAGAIAFGRQWNMRSISAPTAWTAGRTGNQSVKVAILDTGIDYDSPDSDGLVDDGASVSLATTYVRAPTHADSVLTPAQVAARGDNLVRATYFPERAAYTDFNGHGTNVATQVSSKAFAFAGVSSRTTLMAVKVLGSNGAGTLSAVLNGVLWAADHGADVANMSLGGAFAKSGSGRAVGIINQVLNYAKQKGMLVVVAAGNSGIDLHHDGNLYVNYCDAPHVLCVSAVGLPTWTGNPDAPAFYTNYGKNSIGVAAPGGNGVLDASGHLIPRSDWPWVNMRNPTDIASWVWSLCANDLLAGFTAANVPVRAGCDTGLFPFGSIGTSQAAPHVAGLAALLIAQNGKGNPMKIKTLIENSGDDLNPAFGGVLGKRINVARALGLIN